jgi:hypothetical protein
MSEQTLSDAVGIDRTAVEALARASIRTLKELTAADPEAAAMASGIPAERIREWQEKARRAGARPGPSPVAKGWMVGVIGVIAAIMLGSILMAVGSRRLENAERIRATAESKLMVAVSFAAGDAIEQVRQARLALHNENWGNAQRVFSSVEDKVTLIEQVAPESKRKEASELRTLMGDLQSAVNAQSGEASQKLDALEAALDKLKEAG